MAYPERKCQILAMATSMARLARQNISETETRRGPSSARQLDTGCTDSPTWTDSYGDGCAAWYAQNYPGVCQHYPR
eukprot:2760183-Prymnesium_polylepis.1